MGKLNDNAEGKAPAEYVQSDGTIALRLEEPGHMGESTTALLASILLNSFKFQSAETLSSDIGVLMEPDLSSPPFQQTEPSLLLVGLGTEINAPFTNIFDEWINSEPVRFFIYSYFSKSNDIISKSEAILGPPSHTPTHHHGDCAHPSDETSSAYPNPVKFAPPLTQENPTPDIDASSRGRGKNKMSTKSTKDNPTTDALGRGHGGSRKSTRSRTTKGLVKKSEGISYHGSLPSTSSLPSTQSSKRKSSWSTTGSSLQKIIYFPSHSVLPRLLSSTVIDAMDFFLKGCPGWIPIVDETTLRMISSLGAVDLFPTPVYITRHMVETAKDFPRREQGMYNSNSVHT